MASNAADLYMVNIDCVDPKAMADFYSALLGWEIPHAQDEYSMITNGATSIGFGRVAGSKPPAWPDSHHAKRFHLDIQVVDLDQAVASCRDKGASVPDFQPGGDRWTVLLDPEGRPFCLFPGKS